MSSNMPDSTFEHTFEHKIRRNPLCHETRFSHLLYHVYWLKIFYYCEDSYGIIIFFFRCPCARVWTAVGDDTAQTPLPAHSRLRRLAVLWRVFGEARSFLRLVLPRWLLLLLLFSSLDQWKWFGDFFSHMCFFSHFKLIFS